MSNNGKEFQEIGHCGRKFTVSVKTDSNGSQSYQVGISHSRPNPASFVGVPLQNYEPIEIITTNFSQSSRYDLYSL